MKWEHCKLGKLFRNNKIVILTFYRNSVETVSRILHAPESRINTLED